MATNRIKILVVDDEQAMREVLEMRLQEWGFDVRLAADAAEAQRLVESYDPDIVISDVVMPEVSGLELLNSLKTGNPTRPVILITAHANVDMAVEAMKRGAQDFVTKPLDYPKLKAILETTEKEIMLRRKSRKLATRLERGAGFGPFIGVSKPMREVYGLIEHLATSDAPAIITGESGTGKELAARTIHELSARAHGPFVAINSAAIPENLIEDELFGHEKGAFTGATSSRPGCFECADKGTLLLDEIVEMPIALQPKLLRVLEDGRVRRLGGKREVTFDVRVLAATNQDPRQAVRQGRLREDLYYRLNVFTLALPPLRERREDIPLLAHHFISLFNRKHAASVEGLREETLQMLKAYPWPGNVRELKNVIERAVILARRAWIEPSHLPPYIQTSPADEQETLILPIGITAAEAEKALILKTLEQVDHNKAEAARRLGLDVKTIRNKLKRYGIDS
ncbi:MAG: sigma-54-dependent Fis family transcriptional regulator [Acidobacteria bacterium]|nr:MAG: sigma-54-dependent Fis family transcriptional regulator [Acidobacteriota bacterium]